MVTLAKGEARQKRAKVAPVWALHVTAADSDTEGEYIDESAIHDDDSEWDDEPATPDEKEIFFPRIESKVNLTSRPSLLTLMLAQSNRAESCGNQASQPTPEGPSSCTSTSRPSLGGSLNDPDDDEGLLAIKFKRHPGPKTIIGVPRSNARPIAAAANYVHAQAALSPRTTRHNMLATELTESLRRHLLWERQQKSSTANAVLKRWHTSHDVADLKQYLDKPIMKQSENGNTSSYNQYLINVPLDGYHSKGW